MTYSTLMVEIFAGGNSNDLPSVLVMMIKKSTSSSAEVKPGVSPQSRRQA